MSQKFCRDCDWFIRSPYGFPPDLCGSPHATTRDLVTGEEVHQAAKACRAVEHKCGVNAKWFVAARDEPVVPDSPRQGSILRRLLSCLHGGKSTESKGPG